MILLSDILRLVEVEAAVCKPVASLAELVAAVISTAVTATSAR